MLQIDNQTLLAIENHSIETFPFEGCGFVFGEESNGIRYLFDFLPVENSKEGDQRRRFEISAKDYLKAESYANEKQIQLLAIYHSHPEHPAVPSEEDRKSALPFLSYLIVSVSGQHETHTRSWLLNDNRQFIEEIINPTHFHNHLI